MPCQHYEDALIEAAATGAEPRGDLRAHLVNCASCRAAFEEERALFALIDAGLHVTANTEVPASLLPRVRARLLDETPSRRRWIPVWAAVAASVALFIGFLAFRDVRQDLEGWPIESNQVARSLPSAEIPTSPRGNSPTVQLPHAVTRRRWPNQANWSPVREEPRALVPADQPEVIARLLDGLRRGEVKGDVLLADGSGHQSQDLQIAPLNVAPIDVKALDSAQPGVH